MDESKQEDLFLATFFHIIIFSQLVCGAKVARRRLSQLGGDGSRGFGSAKAEEQDPLKALDASIANPEKARGGKPDVAIDEVLRQKRLERQSSRIRCSPASLPRLSSKRRSRQGKRRSPSSRVCRRKRLLLKQEERSRREGREVETLQARRLAGGRLRRVGFLMSHISHLALRHCHLSSVASRGRSSQVRGVVQQRRDRGQGVSGSIFGGSEPGVSSYVASSGSCLVDTRCGDIYRFRLPCCQGSIPLSACNAMCCGVSGEQESGAAAGSRSVRECRKKHGETQWQQDHWKAMDARRGAWKHNEGTIAIRWQEDENVS